MSQIDVYVQEVGPRDGLQNLQQVMPTDHKIAWIGALAQAGVPQIQVGSFVPPKLMPQLADTAEVVRRTRERWPHVQQSVLVPNLKGAQLALPHKPDQIAFVMSASAAHNERNVRRSVEESLADFKRIVALRDELVPDKSVTVSGGIATAFGCTIQGTVPEDEVFRLAEALAEAGADRLGIADTVGYANPDQVSRIYTRVREIVGERVILGAHFHDTRGLGLANVHAALGAGVRNFDGGMGGLGGCPHAPGATGNIVTEDLVFLLEAMGFRTGIDLEKLVGARDIMAGHLPGEPTFGMYVKAGPPKGFVPASAVH
ncbi:MAG: hydroxymethylglutaryl-CoA lyase [Rhodospirillales bacterium]|nr:hydroxymethylglutaryl-CoA lyase [Rhodospirillales bacterium]